MISETGILASEEPVHNANLHDFRLKSGLTARHHWHWAKVFVPWGLYGVVGEWNFYLHPADPTVILGENINWNSEWYYRQMFQCIPRNNLKCHNIDSSNFKAGILEDWIKGALKLNGRDEYCSISDSELKRDWAWSTIKVPFWWHKRKIAGKVSGKTRKTVDMGRNNFLIEAVLKTKRGLRHGGIVSKYEGNKGYVFEIAPDGKAKMSLYFGNGYCSRTSNIIINDGKWHHIIAEVERSTPEGINIYIDGKLSNGTWSGEMNAVSSLSNSADFTVGKTLSGEEERYFAGEIDFLRISRGTLKDAETTIDELYKWEFDGPFLRDFFGN